MTIFWNDGSGPTNAGLDLLGIRQDDQGHEARIAGGITTVSVRGRYLTLLPWLLDEWYVRADGRRDDAALSRALRRVEKLVMLATLRARGHGVPTRGVIGSDLWDKDLVALKANADVDLATTVGGASRDAYAQPCVQLGLLTDGELLGVTPSGRAIAASRRAAIGDDAVMDAIFGEREMSAADVERSETWFSLDGLADAGEERTLLERAVWETSALGDTVRWALAQAEGDGTTPDALIESSHDRASHGDGTLAAPALAYAQYDFLRRIHFALELCLQALCVALSEERRRTVGALARALGSCEPNDLAVLRDEGILGTDAPSPTTLGDLRAALDEASLRRQPRIAAARRDFTGPGKVAYAVALLVIAAEVRKRRPELLPPDASMASEALSVVAGEPGRPLSEIVARLVTMVLDRHQFTTFRKMAAGGPNSLRFVSDGRWLQRTDQTMAAGMSGHRLTSIFTILWDLDLLAFGEGRYRATTRAAAALRGGVS